jgi:hypothetical protein
MTNDVLLLPQNQTCPTRRNAEGPSSVMREWVDELTGRADRASTALRVPTESEISTLVKHVPES